PRAGRLHLHPPDVAEQARQVFGQAVGEIGVGGVARCEKQHGDAIRRRWRGARHLPRARRRGAVGALGEKAGGRCPARESEDERESCAFHRPTMAAPPSTRNEPDRDYWRGFQRPGGPARRGSQPATTLPRHDLQRRLSMCREQPGEEIRRETLWETTDQSQPCREVRRRRRLDEFTYLRELPAH